MRVRYYIVGGAEMLRQYILRKLIKRSLNLDKPLAQVREDVQKLKIDQKKKETTYVDRKSVV